MKQNKLKIAVTGGIGSGKSTACAIIKEEGFPVFSCDEVYAELFNSGIFTAEFIKEFGSCVLDDEGNLSRNKLSEIVFCDEQKLDRLNKITHPKIFQKMFKKAEACEGEVCFFEVPVLFEGGYEKLFDKIIVIMRDENERIKSVMSRDKKSKEEVLSRLNKQYNYKNNEFTQYYVIHNDGKINDLIIKIKELLPKIANS